MPLPCHVARSPLELIGATPIVRLSRLPALSDLPIELWAKLEGLNPGGSVKDRPCDAVIARAATRGALRPGGTIVEATDGNAGPALAMIATLRGYRLVLVVPDTTPPDRRTMLTAFGATLELTPGAEGLPGAIARAEVLAGEHPDWYAPRLYANPDGPAAHGTTTATEIAVQLGRIDAFVVGVGTGATLMGVGPVLRAAHPRVRIWAVEPAGSPVLAGGVPGPHRLDGLGPGFVPALFDRAACDGVIGVTDADAFRQTNALARHEGLLVGPSSGAACAAALAVASRLDPGAVVLTLFPDTGQRHLATDVFPAEDVQA